MESMIPQMNVTKRGSGSQQEFLLQGSVTDASCEDLLHRLRGLCDNSDSNPETFHDHEMVFKMRQPAGQMPGMQLRVRRDVEKKDLPWHLRYLGVTEIGDNSRPTTVRSCVDVACSSNVCSFLMDLGFVIDFEFTSKGFMFKKGRMKIIVGKIFQTKNIPSLDGIPIPSPPISSSYLVELSVVAPSGQDALAKEVREFADQLKPLVHLEKLDHRRLPA